MAVFNNGSITATVTPPQGYTGDYSYELFIYENNNWLSVNNDTNEGFTGSFVNPITKSDTTHTFGNTDEFGNPGGFNDNVEGSDTWVGLRPGQYKVIVTALTGSCPPVESTATVGTDNVTNPDPEFTCPLANFQVADGTTDDPVSATVDLGTLVSVSPATYQEGSATYTATITIPAGYQNAGDTLTTPCTDTATGTTTLPTFDCPLANFQVADGTTDDPVSATVDLGTLVSVSPATYQEGSATYTATITIPAGYQNAGDTLTTPCTDTATGTTTPVSNLIYYFHGFDDDAQEPWATESGGFGLVPFTDATADYYLANTIGGGQSDLNSTPVSLDAVMSHLITNVTVGNYSMLNLDAASGIIFAGQPSATVLNFPAVTTGFDAQYYFAVPQSLTTTNYTIPGTCNLTNQSDGTSALPGKAQDRKEFTYDGITYWLYRMSTPSQGQSYLGFNS